MTPNGKLGWRIGAAAVAVAGTIFVAASLQSDEGNAEYQPGYAWLSSSDSTGPNPLTHHELAPKGKSFIVAFDAAQKAWTLRPTPINARRRAVLLDALAGGEVAEMAWQDYLQFDSTSPWAEEARQKVNRRTATDSPDAQMAQEKRLADWAEVARGLPEAEERAFAALAQEAKEQQSASGEAFLTDVTAWLGSLDARGKASAAEAILLLQSGRRDFAAREVEIAESRLARALRSLHALQSPLALIATTHYAYVLEVRGRAAEAEVALRGNVGVCAPERAYFHACGSQSWTEGIVELRHGRGSAALARFDRALKQFERSGDYARRARLLLLRAETLDSMRATDEAWTDRIKAAQLISTKMEPSDFVLTSLAIAAARDGYFHAADELFSHVQNPANERLAQWRAFTRSRIEGDMSDPNLHLARLGVVRADGAFIRAQATFASARHDVVNVSIDSPGVVSPAPRSDWSELIDEFVPEHVQRQALGVIVAESVRRLYEYESREQAANGSPSAALWMSDRARTVGVPWNETSACIGEQGTASAEEMGRQLIACVPPGVTLVHQDLDGTRLYTWVVRGGRAELTIASVSARELTADIDRFRDRIAGKVGAELLRTQARALYDVLLGPVEQQIAGNDLLVYSPSPNLRGVPVTALHDGLHLLIETRAVVTTPTISAFELPRSVATGASALVVLPQAALARQVLEGARSEVRTVAEIYHGRSTLLTEVAATRETFLESATAYGVIHVATHGQTRAGPYQNSIEFGQERIRAYDVFTLNLTRKPIVMLASCRTADSTGGPMNVSLSDAFLAAGASSVVGSLWDVEDHATEQLSVAFHRELARGATPHDALRTVQLQFIRRGMPISTWAAFQVSS
jgi:CHAT domain-containing protein